MYGEVFIQSHAVPLSWAKNSLTLLEEHDILDYPDPEGCGSVQSYLVLVHSLLSSAASAALWSSCSSHLGPFPFSLLSSGHPSCCSPFGLAALGSFGASGFASATNWHT